MNNFLLDITSPSWWLSVIVAGILVNLIAVYLKPQIDKFFTHLFKKRYQKRNVARERKRQQKIKLLAGDSHEQVMKAFTINNLNLRAIYDLLFGVFFLIIGIGFLILLPNDTIICIISQAIPCTFAAISLISGTTAYIFSNSELLILLDARKASTSDFKASSGSPPNIAPESLEP